MFRRGGDAHPGGRTVNGGCVCEWNDGMAAFRLGETELTVGLLAAYLRAWARHGIHIGVTCCASSLDSCAGVFPTVCLGAEFLRPGPFRYAALVSPRTPFSAFSVPLPASASLPFPAASISLVVVSPEGCPGARSAEDFRMGLERFLRALPPSCRCAVEGEEEAVSWCSGMLRGCLWGRVLSVCPSRPFLPEIPKGREPVVVRVDPRPEPIPALQELIRRCLRDGRELSLYMGEGWYALPALALLLHGVNADLAGRSILRNRAA
ncbi:MAG: hypothetical protein WB626_10280 [Bacteroidota bacterium]